MISFLHLEITLVPFGFAFAKLCCAFEEKLFFTATIWRHCTFWYSSLGLGFRATVKFSATFFHDESSIIGGGGTKVQLRIMLNYVRRSFYVKNKPENIPCIKINYL